GDRWPQRVLNCLGGAQRPGRQPPPRCHPRPRGRLRGLAARSGRVQRGAWRFECPGSGGGIALSQEFVSTRPLLDKLGVKPGAKVALVNLRDPGFTKLLRTRTTDITTGRPTG